MVSKGPDYRALREEKLGIPWDQNIDLSGVKDAPTTPLPTTPETSGETSTTGNETP